ncbi:MAG: Stf0 family sulfotransferase, partial [Pyrinomonadaceae bacterium]
LLIRRRDVFGQAISFYIAERTNQWASSDPNTAGNNAVRYDGAAILRAYRMISDAYSLFDQVITLGQLKFKTIYYEDVVRSPDSLVSSIS